MTKQKPDDKKRGKKAEEQVTYTEVYNEVTDDKEAMAAAVAAGQASTPGVERTKELIADKIRGIREATERMVLANAIEVGQRLYEAKAIAGHGGEHIHGEQRPAAGAAQRFAAHHPGDARGIGGIVAPV